MSTSPSRTSSTGARQRTGRWLSRGLIAVVAVLGVLAMHGLTMNHGAAMPTMSAATGVGAASAGMSADEAMASNHATGSSPTDETVSAPAVEQTLAMGLAGFSATPSPSGNASACVAFLTGLILVFGAGRALCVIRRAMSATGRRGSAWFATAIERTRPDLAEMSVLRT